METAKKKKLHDELRIERQAQKDREEEGEEFEDKDKFVTGAYRAKLAQLKVLAEEEKQKEAEEAANDVTKKKNLNDLYRNLYKGSGSGGEVKVAAELPPETSGAGGAGGADNGDGGAGPAEGGGYTIEAPPAAAGGGGGGSSIGDGSSSSSSSNNRGAGGMGSGSGGGDRTRQPQSTDAHDQPRVEKRGPPAGRRGPPPGKIQRTEEVADPARYASKVSETAVNDARARYLARKAAQGGSKRALPTMDD
jgi:coiled-coil domain-containing protein 55